MKAKASILAACALLLFTLPAVAYIERLLPLKELLDDSDAIFLAKVEAVDPDKPSAVLTLTKKLKGMPAATRLRVNLTGDQEKHTPHLLKRIAKDTPLVVFITELNGKQLVLAYTNGTWFQIIGEMDGLAIRWRFTHCEIYLRRTFKGTTSELEQIVVDALAGKKAPPPAQPKEPPGFGPELETKPPGARINGSGDVLLAVIALPFLLPIAALVQLLFPGLLRDQWRQYQIVTGVLLTQSTLLFLNLGLCRWIITEPQRHWWLSDRFLWWLLLTVAIVGLLVSSLRCYRRAGTTPARPPVRVEYLALGTLLIVGLGYVAWQTWQGASWLDEMAVITVAAGLGILHLLYRKLRFAGTSDTYPARITTEVVFLTGLVATGSALGFYLHQPATTNREAGIILTEWSTARGNASRTGALDPADPGPQAPKLLWSFDPGIKKGRLVFHSSPAVVDDHLYVGAFHQVQALALGYVYCLDASTGQQVEAPTATTRSQVWRFSAEDTLRPVFSSPVIQSGYIYVGEGYHQDKQCRLFCLDARTGGVKWAYPTNSHVESTPTIELGHVIFGAGDDGLICVKQFAERGESADAPAPEKVWQIAGLHVDASPAVDGFRVFAGSTVGDKFKDLAAFAVDVKSGQELWRTPAPLPIQGSPAVGGGSVFFGLGNGKFGEEASNPQGGVWCLDAATGRRRWLCETIAPVMASPVVVETEVFAVTVDGYAFALDTKDGEGRWRQRLPGPVAAAPVVAGGKLYCVTTSGIILCLRAQDGKELWRFDQLQTNTNDVFASPTLVHGRLYVAIGNKIHCIGDPAP